MATGIEELINSLYGMVQDAWSVPFGADKCVIEKDKVLDILDEILAALPADLKMARDIVEKRNDVISSGKRESEAIRKQAEEEAKQILSENEIVKEARKKANDIITSARERSKELKKATNEYCDDALQRTEETITQTMNQLRQARQEFKKATQQSVSAD